MRGIDWLLPLLFFFCLRDHTRIIKNVYNWKQVRTCPEWLANGATPETGSVGGVYRENSRFETRKCQKWVAAVIFIIEQGKYFGEN